MTSFVLYCFAVFLVPCFLLLPKLWFLFAVFPMIIVHYGTHEAVHGTLSPFEKNRSTLNSLFGAIGFAIFGQNFIFMRWSHHAHHKFGRSDVEYTIDGKADSMGTSGRVWYYLCLLGASCIYHEIAGYLYPILGDKYHILSRRFKKKYYNNISYSVNQVFVLLVTVIFLYLFFWKFLICRFVFTIFWGTFQNVAHYGLEIGDYIDSHLASRTYRLPKFIEFLIFRGGAYHLEHHAYPYIPGPNLNSEIIQERLQIKLGFKPLPKKGLYSYIKDCVRQYSGPLPESLEPFKPESSN
jgi:fatty acid desaturase